ncbi:MAG: DDE-type integrase/transposase/recombinase, partial [Pseudomonadota bacterium]
KTAVSWRMDETYINVRGAWMYLFRAVDRAGHTLDFRLSKKRDTKAAKTFFAKALFNNGILKRITIDKSRSNATGTELAHMIRKGQLGPRTCGFRHFAQLAE